MNPSGQNIGFSIQMSLSGGQDVQSQFTAIQQKAKSLSDALAQINKQPADPHEKEKARQQKIEREQKQQYQEKKEWLQKYGGMASTALSGSGSGIVGMMGLPGMVAAMLSAGIDAGLKKATQVVDIHNDPLMTNAHKDQAMVEAIVPMAESLRKFTESVNGVTAKIARQGMQLEQSLARINAAYEYHGKIINIGYQQTEAFARERATYRHARDPMAQINREVRGGEIAFFEEQMRYGPRNQEIMARRDVDTAQEVANYSNKSLSNRKRAFVEAEEALARRKRERDYLRKREDDEGAGIGGQRLKVEIDQANNKVLEANTELEKARAAYENEITRNLDAQNNLAEKQHQLRQATLNVAKAELEILKARESRQASAQQTIGSMSRAELARSAYALKHVQRFGIENVAPETAGDAARIAPEFIRKQREQLGAQRIQNDLKQFLTPEEYKSFDFNKDFEGGGTAAKTREEQAKVQANIDVNIQLDEEKLASQLAKNIDPVFEKLVKIMEISVKNAVDRIQDRAIKQSNLR